MKIAVLIFPFAAAASPADLSGINSDQLMLANPMATASPGPGAVIANPALLAKAKATQQVDSVVTGSRVSIRLLPRTNGVDVSDKIYGARLSDGSDVPRNLATADLRNQRGNGAGPPAAHSLAVGFVTPVTDWLNVGFIGHFKVAGDNVSTFYSDEREAVFSNRVHYALHADDNVAPNLAIGVGAKLGKRWSVGLSTQFLIKASTNGNVFVPEAVGQTSSQTNLTVGVGTQLAPTLGVNFEQNKYLSFSASIRTPHSRRTTGDTAIQLWAASGSPGATSEQAIDFSADWQPWRASFGTLIETKKLRIGIEGTYAHWSTFLNQHNEKAKLKFRNVLDITGHGTWNVNRWQVSTGIGFRSSPVPTQSGTENYADADRIVAGIGGGYRFGKRNQLQLLLALQSSFLLSREHIKDLGSANPVIDEFPDAIDLADQPILESQGLQTNNPGWPGFTISGQIWAASLSVKWYR